MARLRAGLLFLFFETHETGFHCIKINYKAVSHKWLGGQQTKNEGRQTGQRTRERTLDTAQ